MRRLALTAMLLWTAHAHAEATAPLVPVVLDQSVRFESAAGGTVVLEPGNYLGEVSDKPPLRLRSEAGENTWSLGAKLTSHKEKLSRPTLASIAGAKGAHHLLLLLPGGKAIDAVGTTGAVASRAVPAALDAQQITRGVAAARAEDERLLKRSLEPRSIPEKP